MNLDTPIVGTEIDQAAAAIEKLWEPEKDNSPADKQATVTAPADEAEAQQLPPEDETPELDADEAPEEGAEDDSEDDAEQQPKAPLDPNALVTVKIDGKEEQVPLSEALAGYQRQSDFTRKTQALAEERRQFYAAEVEPVRQERQQYAQLLPRLMEQLNTEAQRFQSIDWARLRNEDPIEYALKREELRDAQERAQAIQAESARIADMQAREQFEALTSQVAQERQQLFEKNPRWQDSKAWERDRAALREYGKKLGFSDEELSAAYDHRAILAMHKAMLYDRAMEKRTQAKPVPAPGRPAPSVKPGSSNVPPRQVTDLTRAKQRLAKTGSLDDAAAIFDRIL